MHPPPPTPEPPDVHPSHPCRLPARLPRHLRLARHRRGRPRHPRAGRPGPPDDCRRAVHQGQSVCRTHVPPEPSADADEARGRQGRGQVRTDLVGRGHRYHRHASGGHCRAQPGGHPPVQLRRHDGPGAGGKHGRALLPQARSVAARSHDLRIGRGNGAALHVWREPRHGHRARAGRQADPDLGRQSDRIEPAFLDARAGSQTARRHARRHRSVSLADGREVPSPSGGAPWYRCGAGAGDDPRVDPR